jgi:hypothetical protein
VSCGHIIVSKILQQMLRGLQTFAGQHVFLKEFRAAVCTQKNKERGT